MKRLTVLAILISSAAVGYCQDESGVRSRSDITSEYKSKVRQLSKAYLDKIEELDAAYFDRIKKLRNGAAGELKQLQKEVAGENLDEAIRVRDAVKAMESGGIDLPIVRGKLVKSKPAQPGIGRLRQQNEELQKQILALASLAGIETATESEAIDKLLMMAKRRQQLSGTKWRWHPKGETIELNADGTMRANWSEKLGRWFLTPDLTVIWSNGPGHLQLMTFSDDLTRHQSVNYQKGSLRGGAQILPATGGR